MRAEEFVTEDLRKWFKEKWVRFGPDGKIRGDCARGDDSEGKPKCLPQAKAHALGKKGRKYAASKKRREDPNPERKGQAINVSTKKKSNEGVTEGLSDTQKKIEDTINKLEDRLKHAKTPEQWDNIKDRIERLQAGLKRSKQGVTECLNEMDKSAPQPGRDGKVSHSTYGSRDKQSNAGGKEHTAKAVTAKQASKDALNILKKQGVAEGPGFDKWADERVASQLHKLNAPKTWEVSYDYGPHMTKTVTVKARSEDEARAKVEKAAEKKGMSIMINSVEQQGVAEATGNTGLPHDFTAVQPGAEVWYKGRFAGWTTGKVYDDPYGKAGKMVAFEPNPSEFPGDDGRILSLPYDEVGLRKSTSIGKLKGPGQGVAEGLNEFAPDSFNSGNDGEEFSPEMAKMAYDDGFTKGAGLADGATLERAMAINDWDKHDGGIYKQHFAKGFKKGRMDKIRHNNKQYNLNLQLMKDGSIRHGEQGVAEAELDEACWKGYHKEGNKEMFGKTYPNCVKNKGSKK